MAVQLPVEATATLAQQDWLEPPAKSVQKAVKAVWEAGGDPAYKVKDFLHGVWLGHPLHSVLTDVPIGAWTATLMLDALNVVTGHRGFGAAADATVGLGVVSALGAAAAGLTDFQHVSGQARKVGLVHAISNIVATGLFTGSWFMRGRRQRAAGRGLGLLGYLAVLVGGYLGGHLVYAHRIGVNQAAADTGPDKFTPVMPVDELKAGQLHKAMLDKTAVLLFRRGDRILAIAETCAHLGGPLSEGKLVEDDVICPWHNSRFRLEDGQVVHGPSVYDQPCYETRVRNGQVEIRAQRQGMTKG